MSGLLAKFGLVLAASSFVFMILPNLMPDPNQFAYLIVFMTALAPLGILMIAIATGESPRTKKRSIWKFLTRRIGETADDET